MISSRRGTKKDIVLFRTISWHYGIAVLLQQRLLCFVLAAVLCIRFVAVGTFLVAVSALCLIAAGTSGLALFALIALFTLAAASSAALGRSIVSFIIAAVAGT